jgi:hypothetical protein
MITLLTTETLARRHWLLTQNVQPARTISLIDEPLPLLPLPLPFILDTTGLTIPDLARLLHHLRECPLVALVEPQAYGRQMLVSLVPSLLAVVSLHLEPPVMAPLLHLVTNGRVLSPFWCGIAPPPRLLNDPDLLPIFAALPNAATMRDVANIVGFTERTVRRKLARARIALDLLPGKVAHYPPPVLATLFATILEDPSQLMKRFQHHQTHRAA